VFPADLARDWFAQVGDYLETNHYEQLEVRETQPSTSTSLR